MAVGGFLQEESQANGSPPSPICVTVTLTAPKKTNVASGPLAVFASSARRLGLGNPQPGKSFVAG